MSNRISVTLRAIRRNLRAQSPKEMRPPEPLRRALASQSPTLLLLNDCRDQISYGCEVLMEGLVRILTAAIPDHTLRHIPSHWLMETQFFPQFYEGSSLVQPVAIWPEVADEFE